MNKTKANQHFVPRSLLKGFTIDNEDSLIWGYDKKYSKCTSKKSIDHICSSKNYYEQVTPDGSKTQILEDGFEKIEAYAIKIIRNLLPPKKFSSLDKGCLAFYIALLLTRGLSFRDGIQEYHKHMVDIMLQKEYQSGRLPEPPEIVKKHIVNDDITSVIKTQIKPHISLQYMLEWADNISQSLCCKKWEVYHIENNNFFITSDTPVLFESINTQNNQNIGPAHPQAMFFCPITKKTLIIIRPYYKSDYNDFEFKVIKDEMLEALNKFFCFNAQRFVYLPEKSDKLLEYIKEAKGMRKRFWSCRLDNIVISKWDIEHMA